MGLRGACVRPDEGEGAGYQIGQVRRVAVPGGEADKWSLTPLGEHGDAASITVERELVNGEVIDPELLRRVFGSVGFVIPKKIDLARRLSTILKRGITGKFHHVSEAHFHCYLFRVRFPLVEP
jgi:hypothetical protein